MTSLPRISVAQPSLDGNERDYVMECMDSTWISSAGRFITDFEKAFANYCGVKHAITCNNGTTALHLALVAMGIGPGDEVIIPSLTYIASCNAVTYCGGTVVLVDNDPRTFNVDPAAIEAKITPRTKAIMPVHLFGQMADTAALAAIAKRHGIPVIEDAAQSLGSELGGVRAGAAGTAGTYSFFPSKNLGAFGDGGMVVTTDDEVAARLRLLRNQGQQPKYFSVEVGGNFRLDALQAAVVRAKLPHLDGWTAARQRNAARYRKLFAATDTPVGLPSELPDRRHVYNQFVIRAPGGKGGKEKRDALRAYLGEIGIGSEVYYPQPMHLQKCFAGWGHAEGAFPESEKAANESLAIPIYPELTEEMQAAVAFHQDVVAGISAFYRR